MGNIASNWSIVDVVRAIEADEFRLPSIQRWFVWTQEQTYKLLDSIMNGYPIGSLLVWEPAPYLQVRSRKFVDNFRATATRLVSQADQIPRNCRLVLDGQQRLQSLFLAFKGSYDAQQLFFRANSDPDKPPEDMRYEFRFLPPGATGLDTYWLRPSEIAALQVRGI